MRSVKLAVCAFFLFMVLMSPAIAEDYTQSLGEEYEQSESDQYIIRFGRMAQRNGRYYVVEQTDDIMCRLKNTGYRFGFTVDSETHKNFRVKFVVNTPDSIKVYDSKGKFQSKTNTMIKELKTSRGNVSWNIWFRDCGRSILGVYSAEIYINGKLSGTKAFTIRK